MMRPAPVTTPDVWGALNRTYPETSGRPGPRDPNLTPYMTPLARKAASGEYKTCVGVTSAQSGKTETILDIIGERLDTRPAPILYVGPSKEFNTDQFEPRFSALFTEAPALAMKVAPGRQKKTLKRVAGVRVRLAHAGSSTALKSDPAALALLDEYDEMQASIKGQGDPYGLVKARGDTYADFVMVVTSTPSIGGVETEIDPVNGLELWAMGNDDEIKSPTWRLWQGGTRHHWAWPCPECGDYFVPMRRHLQWPKGATPAQARRTAYLCCPINGCIIKDEVKDGRSTRERMNDGGVMIAPGQTIEDALADRNHPDNMTWSQWSSGLCSPFVTWGDRAHDLLKVEAEGDPNLIQTQVNAGFGEVFSAASAGDLPDWKELLQHRIAGLSARKVPRGALYLTMGVDVQTTGLYFVVRGWGAGGTSWLIDHGFMIGDTGDNAVWRDMYMYMTAPIDGLRIVKVFIDSGFRPDKKNGGSEHIVYEFCRRYSYMCSPTKGRGTIAGKPYSVAQIEVKQDGKKRPYSIKLVHVNTDFFKSLVHTRVKSPLDQPGAFHLNEDADEEYARQILSEVRIIDPVAHKPKWVKTRGDNHFLDAEALAAVGGFVLNVQMLPEGIQRDVPDDPEAGFDDDFDGEEAVDVVAEAPPPPPVAARSVPAGKSDIRERFRNMSARLQR